MATNALCAALEVQLNAELDAVRAETGRADAWLMVAHEPDKYPAAYELAMKLFAYSTIFNAHWIDGGNGPDARTPGDLAGEDAARAVVAVHLADPPRQGDDRKHWRVSFPYVFSSKSGRVERTRNRDENVCIAVCKLIMQGKTRKDAVDAVAPRFNLESRRIEMAYDHYRAQIEPMVRFHLLEDSSADNQE